jgi:hypothetical protein
MDLNTRLNSTRGGDASLISAMDALTAALTDQLTFEQTLVDRQRQSATTNTDEQPLSSPALQYASYNPDNLTLGGTAKAMINTAGLYGSSLNPMNYMRALSHFQAQGNTPPPTTNQQGAGQLSPSASVASAATGGIAIPGESLQGSGQAALYNASAAGSAHGSSLVNQNSAVTMAMLGEHGAPEPIRNLVMGSYGTQQSLNWAQTGAQSLASKSFIPNSIGQIDPETGQVTGALGSVAGALNIAAENPLAAYAMASAVGSINEHAKTSQTIGESFGYGAGSNGSNAYFGFRNPLNDLGTASRIGYSFDLEKQALEGRTGGMSGLTSTQATTLLDMLGDQGFSENPLSPTQRGTGNASTIANSFSSLLRQTPGLTTDELAPFTDSLRNAGASATDVSDTLSQLGNIAKGTSQNINSLYSAAASAAETFQSMGSTQLGGLQAAEAFQEGTGIQGGIQAASSLAQSPIVQGLNLAQNGILPSGMGDENAGVFASTSQQAVRMLAQATRGLDRNHYRTIDGVRTLIASGKQQQYDQIASMLGNGMTSNAVRAILNPNAQGGDTNRENLQAVVGNESANNATGLWADVINHPNMTNAQRSSFNQKFDQATSARYLKGTGISSSQIQTLDQVSDPRTRLKDLQTLLSKTTQSKLNTAQATDKGVQQVQVAFTGAAAKWFQTVGTAPTPSQNQANAGGTAYNAIVNGQGGDPANNLGTYNPSWVGH